MTRAVGRGLTAILAAGVLSFGFGTFAQSAFGGSDQTSPDEHSHGNYSPGPDGVKVLRTDTDADSGLTWSLVSYGQSAEERCLDLKVYRTDTDEYLGALGACGPASNKLAGVLAGKGLSERPIGDKRGTDPEGAEVKPVTGQIVLPDKRGGESIFTIVAGAVSCRCNIRTTFGDDTIETVVADNGAFIVTRRTPVATPAPSKNQSEVSSEVLNEASRLDRQEFENTVRQTEVSDQSGRVLLRMPAS